MPIAHPYSEQAEQSVLGALLLDNSVWDLVADRLRAADFFFGDHQTIYRAIQTCIEGGTPADILTVSTAIEGAALGEDATRKVLAYLVEIANNTPSSANAGHYADIVAERAHLRALQQIGFEASRKAAEPSAQGAELQEYIEQQLYAVATGRGIRTEFVNVHDALSKVLGQIEERYEAGDQNDLTGTPTGLVDLDEATGGLQPSDYVVVAGRPSMGKTALALGFVEAALTIGPVQLYSLEMPARALVLRFLSRRSGIAYQDLMRGRLHKEEDWQHLTAAVGAIANYKLALDETSALSMTELRAKARRSARQLGKPALVVVDYLQLMRGADADSRNDNRAREIAGISAGLKSLAKELDCPVVALSQLNRGLETRTNKRPVMADLRESGAIEQDADLIMFVYRDEVYNPDSQDKGTAEIIIGKHRNGSTGTIRTAFVAQAAKFADLQRHAL